LQKKKDGFLLEETVAKRAVEEETFRTLWQVIDRHGDDLSNTLNTTLPEFRQVIAQIRVCVLRWYIGNTEITIFVFLFIIQDADKIEKEEKEKAEEAKRLRKEKREKKEKNPKNSETKEPGVDDPTSPPPAKKDSKRSSTSPSASSH